jgi:hypothetical protein
MWMLGMLVALRSRRFLAFKRRLFGSLRVAGYVTVVSGLSLVFLSSRADAQLREQSRSLSQELLPIADLLKDATSLRLNGEVVNFSMTIVEGTSVKQVLDRVQAQCEKQPGPLAQQSLALIAGLPKALPGADAAAELLSRLVVTRQEAEGQGAVLCFTGDGSPLKPTFAEDFERTHDLGELGRLRYVMAGQGKAAQGEQHQTRVISLWTEGQFRLDRLAPPETGDAPGADSALVPRPPSSVRIFSAETLGAPYAVRIYETDSTPRQVLAYYDARMAAFKQLTMQGYEETGRAYIKDAIPLLLHLTQRDSKTVVTISELGGATDLERVKRVDG